MRGDEIRGLTHLMRLVPLGKSELGIRNLELASEYIIKCITTLRYIEIHDLEGEYIFMYVTTQRRTMYV